jgi:hypothetical protein
MEPRSLNREAEGNSRSTDQMVDLENRISKHLPAVSPSECQGLCYMTGSEVRDASTWIPKP